MASYTDEDQSTVFPLFHAAFIGNHELLQRFAAELNSGETLAETFVRVKNSDHQTALHISASGGRTQICKYLIEHLELDVNLEDGSGESPLHHATYCQEYPTVKYLLNHGANPNLANREDRSTPLHYAAQQGRKELVNLLIERGAEIEAKSLRGTPLHFAAAYGKKDALLVLLQHKANPNSVVDSFFTPLMAAILFRSFDCVEPLLKAGADPNYESHGLSPLAIAAAQGDMETIKFLLEHGANANVTNLSGLTPLEVAALKGHRKVCEILFKKTDKLPCINDWTVVGVLSYVSSEEAKNQSKVMGKERFLYSKSRGDASFKNNGYLDAIFWYTEALEAESMNAAVLSNRSLCWARLKEGERALEDAEACISVKSGWPKAHYRAGVAYILLQNYARAVEKFDDALKLDPGNTELQAALSEALQAKFGQES